VLIHSELITLFRLNFTSLPDAKIKNPLRKANHACLMASPSCSRSLSRVERVSAWHLYIVVGSPQQGQRMCDSTSRNFATHEYTCYGCTEQIPPAKARIHCEICPNYDLCANCFVVGQATRNYAPYHPTILAGPAVYSETPQLRRYLHGPLRMELL
jgi:hypothetical protein